MAKKKTQKYWRDKADAAWSDEIRKTGKCEICDKPGKLRKKDSLPVVGLESHHLIPRGILKFRHDLSNGICLCVSCHGAMPRLRNRRMSAHSAGEAGERFWAWLKENRPGQGGWYEENKHNKTFIKMDYEEIYYRLKGE